MANTTAQFELINTLRGKTGQKPITRAAFDAAEPARVQAEIRNLNDKLGYVPGKPSEAQLSIIRGWEELHGLTIDPKHYETSKGAWEVVNAVVASNRSRSKQMTPVAPYLLKDDDDTEAEAPAEPVIAPTSVVDPNAPRGTVTVKLKGTPADADLFVYLSTNGYLG